MLAAPKSEVLKPGEVPKLYRARVIEIGPQAILTVRVGPEAAKQLRPGDSAGLVRPLRATTALMEKLPDVIAIEGPSERAAADAAQAARLAQMIDNLKQIGLAMHNYHAAHNALPPAVVHGPDGKPWHSWRILILPYLEQASVYDRYDFSQPWDGEGNRKLLGEMPAIYRAPIDGGGEDAFTNVAVVTGPRTPFPPDGTKLADPKLGDPAGQGRRIRFRDITDGNANTALVAPVSPERKIPWTKPEDIVFEDKDTFPAPGRPDGIATPYRDLEQPDGPALAPILFADGSVRTISSTIGPRVLAALLTRDGGEVFPPDAISPGPIRPPARMIHFVLQGQTIKATIEPMEPDLFGAPADPGRAVEGPSETIRVPSPPTEVPSPRAGRP